MNPPNDTPHSRTVADFLHACESGDEAVVRAMLAADPSLATAAREEGHGGWTALHSAARSGHAAIVRALLAHGATVDAREHGDNTTPLHWGAAAHHTEVVRTLIEHGCDVHGIGDAHALDVIGWATVFSDDRTIAEARTATIAQLVGAGARHHIFSALALGDAALVREVVRDDPRALDRRLSHFDGALTPLHFALRQRRHDLLSLLLELGADVTAIDGRGDTPLLSAIMAGDREAMERLTAAGATLPATGGESGIASVATLASRVRHGSVMLPVLDIGATLAWYTSIGFTEVARYGEDGVLNFGMVKFGNAEVMFSAATRLGEPKPSLWFYVDGIDALYGAFRARQLQEARDALRAPAGAAPTIVFQTDIYDPFYGGREFALRDLNGYILNFHQPADQ